MTLSNLTNAQLAAEIARVELLLQKTVADVRSYVSPEDARYVEALRVERDRRSLDTSPAEIAAVHAVFGFHFNVCALDLVKATYGRDADTPYLIEKAEYVGERGIADFWGILDTGSRARLVSAAIRWSRGGSPS